MAITINKKVINLSSTGKEASLIKRNVQWMRENLSENGKHVVFVWDESKKKKNIYHRVIRGFSQGGETTPRGHLIEMFSQVGLFENEGEVEVVYSRRAPAQQDGYATNLKLTKEVFQGRMVVNLDRQPDLAFFLYYACPQCKGGQNSNGSNVFKVQNREAEAQTQNMILRRKAKLQMYVLNNDKEGGCSYDEITYFAEGELDIANTGRYSEQVLRNMVFKAIGDDAQASDIFITFAEKVIMDRVSAKPGDEPKPKQQLPKKTKPKQKTKTPAGRKIRNG